MAEESVTPKTNGQAQEPTAAEIRAAMAVEYRALTDILLDRFAFMRQNGITFNGARDEYVVLGYDRLVTNEQYYEEYLRGGVAARIVDAMPNATWRGAMELVEDEDPEKDTPFEEAWKALDQRLQIQAKLLRADKLAGLSTYAVLLIGAPGELSEPLEKVSSPDKVFYLTPFIGGGGPQKRGATARASAWDSDAVIEEFETDVANPRFGLPKTYRLRRTDFASDGLGKPVHWSRVVHIAEGLLRDEVYGLPRLERVWNLLVDLRKVTGGGAEAFWLRANQGLHANVDKDMATPDLATVLAALKDQSEEYKHQITRWLRTKGVEVKTLGSDVANFANPADAILTQIAGATAMPKRILTGSEMGELASSQDRDNWKDQINGRQTSYAGPYIVRPLVRRLVEYGYLPTPKNGPEAYEVRWPHIETLTEKDKAEGAKAWAAVNQALKGAGLPPAFTDSEIRDKWYGMAPLEPEQLAEMAERAETASPAAPPEPEPEPEPEEEVPEELKAAAEAALASGGDEEILRVLEDALALGATEVVERIVGPLGGVLHVPNWGDGLRDGVARCGEMTARLASGSAKATCPACLQFVRAAEALRK